MFNTYLLDCLTLIPVLFRLVQSFLVMVIAAPGEFGCYQEFIQWIFLPQFRDNDYFFPFPRSATKAFNFFRYSFSARRYSFSASSCSNGVSGGFGF